MSKATIYSTLTNDATLAALVGSRVYPSKLPQAVTFPAVMFTRVGGPRDVHLSGASGSGRPRYRFDCWADTHDGAEAVFNALRDAMDGLGAVAAMDATDLYDSDEDAHRITIDYYHHHQEV